MELSLENREPELDECVLDEQHQDRLVSAYKLGRWLLRVDPALLAVTTEFLTRPDNANTQAYVSSYLGHL